MHPLRSRAPTAVRGFSLVELLVTLAVLAIVMSIGVPSFTGMTHRNKLSSATNELVAGLQLARSEAVRQNARVVLCPSTDGAACSGDAWSQIIVFADADGDGDVSGDEEVIRNLQVTAGDITLTPSANVETNQRISFGSDGFARIGGANARTGAISVCNARIDGDNTRDVSINVARVSVASRNGTEACTGVAN
jgi:type IV fimbrial biogenesis protein FimT